MPETRKKWSFRRWRRRWHERLAALSLRWRIWFDRHILSHETRRAWRRRWNRRSQRIGQAVEKAGYKVLPNRPAAAPDTPLTRFLKRIDDFVGTRIYPPEIRRRHAREFQEWWFQFTTPFRQANARVGGWLGDFLLPALTPAGFRKSFFNWKGALGVAVLVGLAFFVAFWLVPGWRSHNESKWAAQARLLLDRGYQSMAQQNAVRVLQHNENNADAARVLAEILEQRGSPDALHWRRVVVACSNSPSNQLALAATALRFERVPYPTASNVLASITGPATNSLQFQVVAAQFEAKTENWMAAEKRYLAALALAPTNSDVQLALALLRVSTRDPAKISWGESTLASLSQQTNTAVRALRPLVRLAAARGNFDAAVGYSKRILVQESSTFEDRLMHLDVLTRKRDPGCATFQALFQEQVSADSRLVAQLAGWMTAHQQTRDARLWIGRLPAAIQHSDLVRMAQADTYVAEADWLGLEQFLLQQPEQGADANGWGTIEFVRQALLARAYRGIGDRRAFADNFAHAKEIAAGMAQRLKTLTWMVAKWGWDSEVEELLWTTAERFPAEAWATDELLKKYHDRNSTEGIRRVFALQYKHSPKDSLLKNNLAMVMLLQGIDLPTAHQLARESHAENPNDPVNTSTYAFSLLRQGKPAEARKAMEVLGKKALEAPNIAAYYAIITAATGDQQTARQYLALARNADLFPEEKSLLDGVRKNF